MSVACYKELSIIVTADDCGGVDWTNNASALRPRIKDFNPAVFTPCETSDASGLPEWDGTLIGQGFPCASYGIQTGAAPYATKSLRGKNLAGDFYSHLIYNFGMWFFFIRSWNSGTGGYEDVWTGSRASPCPLGAYNFGGGCSGGPDVLELEAYTP